MTPISRSTLVELMRGYKAQELGIFAIYRTRKQLSLKVRKLVDFLVAALRSSPWIAPRDEGGHTAG